MAEKEKALQEEQEALISAQSKLREIRAEQNAERSNLQQRIRQLDEIVQAKQVEIQTINGRMHGQVQQLKAQLNEEIMKTRKMCDEHTAMQMQRQQLEMRLGQMQEAEATIVQLRNELQELQSRSNVEMHTLKDQHMNTISQLQHQLNMFKNDIGKKEDMIRNFTVMKHDSLVTFYSINVFVFYLGARRKLLDRITTRVRTTGSFSTESRRNTIVKRRDKRIERR